MHGLTAKLSGNKWDRFRGDGTWAANPVVNVKDYGAVGDGVADDSAALQLAIIAVKALAAGSIPGLTERGATLFFPTGQYKITTGYWNFDETYGIRLEGQASVAGPGTTQACTILFKQTGGAAVDLISANGAINFQMFRLDVAYDNPTFAGDLISNTATTHNAIYGHFENCNFMGAPDSAYLAASLVNVTASLNIIFKGCSFQFAQVGIEGTSSYTVSVDNCVFISIDTGAGIHNPGQQWLVQTSTFEYNVHVPGPYANMSVGIYGDSGISGNLTILDCWFGDGSGGRPWVKYNGTVLNVIGSFMSTTSGAFPCISIAGVNTVHNVTLTGNWFQPTTGQAVIKVEASAVLESLLMMGNWVTNGGISVSNAGTLMSKTIIETNDTTSVGFLTSGKVLATAGLGVGNSAAATTPGSVVKKIQVFDAAGSSLGYLPVYDAIA